LRLLLVLRGLLRLLGTETLVGLVCAHRAQLFTLLGDQVAALSGAQFCVAQFLPLLGHQVTQLLALLQAGLRVVFQRAGLLRAGSDITLLALFRLQIAHLVTLLRAQLLDVGRLEVLCTQFLALLRLQFAQLLARLSGRDRGPRCRRLCRTRLLRRSAVLGAARFGRRFGPWVRRCGPRARGVTGGGDGGGLACGRRQARRRRAGGAAMRGAGAGASGARWRRSRTHGDRRRWEPDGLRGRGRCGAAAALPGCRRCRFRRGGGGPFFSSGCAIAWLKTAPRRMSALRTQRIHDAVTWLGTLHTPPPQCNSNAGNCSACAERAMNTAAAKIAHSPLLCALSLTFRAFAASSCAKPPQMKETSLQVLVIGAGAVGLAVRARRRWRDTM
jgi:hypothetical protein